MMLMSQVCLIIKISGNVQKDHISIAQQSIHSLTPPPSKVTNGGYEDFKILNNGERVKKFINFGATKDT